VLMRALIHRRVALVAQGIGDVLLIGSVGSDHRAGAGQD
jgi:thioredoxin reductase (NADPH)